MTQRIDEAPAGKSPTDSQKQPLEPARTQQGAQSGNQQKATPPAEHGGRPGLDPTRYGDWEKNGRCVDF